MYIKSAIKEKTHIYEEELRSKTNQVERYQKKIVNLELENTVMHFFYLFNFLLDPILVRQAITRA